jgi:hypothetical protein
MNVLPSHRLVTWLPAAAGLVLALLPAVSRGALSLGFGPPDGTNPASACLPGTHFVDLIFADDSTEDEGLYAYDLVLNLVTPAGRPGDVRIAGAERPPTDFVLSDDPNKSTFTIAQGPGLTDDRRITVNISSNNDLFDITTGKKAARLFYTIAPGALPGQFSLAFDPANTVFGSGDPNRLELALAVGLADAGSLQICPEPGTLSITGLAGLLCLSRRRRAA